MTAKAKVLVIDDEPDIRELMCFNLSREGYEVSSGESGEDCLKILEDDNKFDAKYKTLPTFILCNPNAMNY